jgi:hypothetical protein
MNAVVVLAIPDPTYYGSAILPNAFHMRSRARTVTRPSVLLLAVLCASSACETRPGRFLVANARAHVNNLAGTIGSRPLGSDENRRAREYIVDQLSLYGFTVRLQETDAVRPEIGLTARVVNIIAMRPGSSADAIGLMAHYDSSQHAPGAGDDALGTAVCLEAGRILAARQRPNRTLMILITDGEETGLMGAAGLTHDEDVRKRLRAYINVEAIGSGEPSLLFETGPGHQPLVDAWARSAPRPRGSSYATEIYKRLPNDTDFTVFKEIGIPGLNFAAVGESFTYHTARDTPERLSTTTLQRLGDNVLEIADTMDRTDLNGSNDDPVFFDLLGRRAVVYSMPTSRLLSWAALLVGLFAWLRLLRHAVRSEGEMRRVVMTMVWVMAGVAIVGGLLCLVISGVRWSREVYHPWYAHPRRLQALLLITGLVTGRLLVHAARRLPVRFQGSPSAIWHVTLPFWLMLGFALSRLAPRAAYLWILPLAAAGAALALLPLQRRFIQAASGVVLIVTAALWIPDWWNLWMFVVAQMGRLPIVTPVAVYAALVIVVAMMIVPPAWAALGERGARPPMIPPGIVTSFLLVLLVIAAGLVYSAPAYSVERPLRGEFRLVQLPAGARWEIGSTEPWLDFGWSAEAPRTWRPWTRRDRDSPVAPFRQPFLFESSAPRAAFPGIVRVTDRLVDGQTELQVIVSAPPVSTVMFVMPPGVTPDQPSLAGVVSRGRWKAAFSAPGRDGIEFTARIPSIQARLDDAFVVIRTPRLPGGSGWQGLPSWLPVERVVWSAEAVYVEALGSHLERPADPAAGTAPVTAAEPLR